MVGDTTTKIDKDANITIGNGFGSIGKTTLIDRRVYFTADGVNQIYENTSAGVNEMLSVVTNKSTGQSLPQNIE